MSENLTIAGKVLSEKDGLPLPFATVSLKGKPVGVVSNEVGEFNLKIDDAFRRDTLIISSLGYESFTQPIETIDTNGTLTVSLKEKPFVLGEVVIEDKKVPALEIIKNAIAKIRDNYPQRPYLMEGFYRDYKKENGKYIGLFEAAVSVYDQGYRHSNYRISREKVFLNEVRNIKQVEYKTDLHSDHNILERLLAQNEPRYLSNALDYRNLRYELDGYTYLDDKLVYVVKTNAPWTSHLYIDTENYAILKVTLDAKWEGAKKNEWALNDSTMNRVKFVKKTLQFKEFDGNYFPVYMSYAGSIEGVKKGTEEITFTSYFQQELLINNVLTTDIKIPPKENLMSMFIGLEWQKRPYNESFWEEYNIIKDSPLDEQIIRDLENAGRLEDQFGQDDQ